MGGAKAASPYQLSQALLSFLTSTLPLCLPVCLPACLQCVEDCEDRFSEPQIEELLQLVRKHLLAATAE